MGDIRTTTGVKPPEPKTVRQRKAVKRALLVIAILAAIAAFGFIPFPIPRYALASGYATTEGYAEVRSATAGRVAEILATSGNTVEKGAPLLRLEDEAEQAAVSEAEGQVADASGQVSDAESLVAEAQRNVEKGVSELALREATVKETLRLHAVSLKMAELDVSQTQTRLERTQQLHAKGLASGSKLADDTFAFEKAKNHLESLKAQDTSLEEKQLEVLRCEVEARKDALNRAKASLSRAQASLARAQATLTRARVALENRVVTAPIAGRVVRYTFYVGEMIRSDMVLYEIFDGEVNLLKIRVPEQYAGRVKAGMPLKATLGTYKTLVPTRFWGKVEVLRDVVEGEGDSYYRVAYCSFDRQGREVAPGTSVEARIRYGTSNLWLLLFQP